MTRLTAIEAHITSMCELLDIAGAMRSLAGMRMIEAQRALPGIQLYAAAVAAGIADTVLLMRDPEPQARPGGGRLALVLCTAEHGFVGGFSERLVAAADRVLGQGDLLFILGTRGAALALERGHAAAWTHPMATRCAAAPETIQALSAELYGRIARGEIGRVEVMHALYRQGAEARIERRLLLPFDLATLSAQKRRQPPLHNLRAEALHESLIAEYVFALLTEAAVESISSENAARFAAMASAHENVTRKLDDLRGDARQVRQSEITAELLDLVTGAEAQA